MPDESFANAVRDKLAFLLTEHGFRIVDEDEHSVRLEAVNLCAEAAWDPRGEVDVNVFRRGHRESGMWSYVGMVGKATVPRLLEIAGERMRADDQVLLGNATFYEHLAADQKKAAEEWTAYYSRKGPRPRTNQLP
jgi:hypothetical protein